MYVEPAPTIEQLAERVSSADEFWGRSISPPIDDERNRYLHWDKLRRLPAPGRTDHEQWWLKIKFARHDVAATPAADRQRTASTFGYTLPDQVHRSLHHIDQRGGGEVAMDEVVTSEREAGRRFLVNSLMEEAIRSSQLEGATTSRVVAKELLRSGRAPRDRSEQMIANNYRALQLIKEMDGDLTPAAVLELHRVVTEGTLDDPSAAGRLQRAGRRSRRRLRPRRGPDADPRSAARRAAARAARGALRFRQRGRRRAASSTRSCGRSCCTSGSPTTTRSRTATDAPRGSCSSG